MSNSNLKAVTLRIPEPVHRKLRMLAASKGITMTEKLVELIMNAKLESPDEVATVKSLIHTAAGESAETKKAKRAEPENEQKTNKLEPYFNI